MNVAAFPILITSLSFVLIAVLLRNRESMNENESMLYAVLLSSLIGLGSLVACAKKM